MISSLYIDVFIKRKTVMTKKNKILDFYKTKGIDPIKFRDRVIKVCEIINISPSSLGFKLGISPLTITRFLNDPESIRWKAAARMHAFVEAMEEEIELRKQNEHLS